MHGLLFKRNADEILDRRRRFLNRQMQDSILCSFGSGTTIVPGVSEDEWLAFEHKWGGYQVADKRPCPSNEEIYDRLLLGLESRKSVEDDRLPVVYSTLDFAEGIVYAWLDLPVRFYHRPRYACYSKGDAWEDYSQLPAARYAGGNRWVRRAEEIHAFFRNNAQGRFGEHPTITMDALNFACEVRGATNALLDLYEHPQELRKLMALGVDCNIQFQAMQMREIGEYAGGSFAYLAQWVPFPRAVGLSVDSYVICSVDTYARFGFEYQQRLIDHFGHGLMHLHCNRADLAAEIVKLRGLALLQYGGDTRDKLTQYERLPEMKKVAGEIPIQTGVEARVFRVGLRDRTLPPNVWYIVDSDEAITMDEANTLMDEVRSYRA